MDMAIRIASDMVANVVDFDMHNLIPLDNEEGEDSKDVMPSATLHGHSYGVNPLVIQPKYTGDFLEKMRQEYEGKFVDAASDDNLLDFSMPSEMLKHQEQPYPRDLRDDYYEFNRPGDGAGYDILKDYWTRGWQDWETPEISEDLLDRYKLKKDDPAWPMVMRIVESHVHNHCCPHDIQIDLHRLKQAKLMSDLEKSQLFSHGGYKPVNIGGVSARLYKAEPALARWTFLTGSGKGNYFTVFQFIPERGIKDPNKLNVRVYCTCPAWIFWGAQFNAVRGGYAYGPVRPKFAPPVHRDPSRKFLVCKHILACIPLISTKYRLPTLAPGIAQRLHKPVKLRLDERFPDEPMRMPKPLQRIEKRKNIRDVVLRWDAMSRKEHKDFIMGLEEPDEILFMAHRFPETATVFVAEKLKNMLRSADSTERAWANKALRVIHDDELKRQRIKIPIKMKELQTYAKSPAIKKVMVTWPSMSADQKNSFISGLKSPGAIAYLIHEFPKDIGQIGLDRLNELAEGAEGRGMQELAKKVQDDAQKFLEYIL